MWNKRYVEQNILGLEHVLCGLYHAKGALRYSHSDSAAESKAVLVEMIATGKDEMKKMQGILRKLHAGK